MPDPFAALLLLVITGIYVRAVRVLASRGHRVKRGQIMAFAAAVALLAVALLTPVDSIGERSLFSVHMVQHILIADFAAPLILIGLRSPVMLHLWPRPVLVKGMRSLRVRRFFSFVVRPYIAVPIWVLTIYAWHFPALFELALREPAVHMLQHQTFMAASLLAWWPLIEPLEQRLGEQLWKIAHIVSARTASAFLGGAFIVLPSVAYSRYAQHAPDYGITGLADQRLAGALMMGVDFVLVIGCFTYFFFRAAKGSDSI